MQKVLGKRVFRDLRENLFRYLALGFLVIIGMYIIVSLIGAGVTIIDGSHAHDLENQCEDGQFEVFVPLTDAQTAHIEDAGAQIEPMFYEDYAIGEGKVVRVFANRRQINLAECDTGRLAQTADEIAVEKRFSEVNGIQAGDTLTIADHVFTVTGIVTSPDYNAPFKELADSVVDSGSFGTAFVTESTYELLHETGKSDRTQTYLYAYLLDGNTTDEDVREAIKDIKVDADAVDDPMFQEYWDRTGAILGDFQSGVADLVDGSRKLSDGLDEINGHNDDLNDAAQELFDAYLEQAAAALRDYGFTVELTEDNFSDELRDLAVEEGGLAALSMTRVRKSLESIQQFKDGIFDYTDAVTEVGDGAQELADGVGELRTQTDDFLKDYDTELANLTMFLTAADNSRIGGAADDQQINVQSGYAFGVLLMMLFAYVISVFVVHGIERESSVIGALYALGVKRGDLMLHYLTLPVCVTTVAGLIGFALGISSIGIPTQMADAYAYYSIPPLDVQIPPVLIVYGVIMPPAVAVIVNFFVIRKKLSRTALSLIRNEVKQTGVSHIDLGNMGFVGRFRVRQMLREMRTGITVVLGMFLSLVCLMLSLNTAVLCNNVKVNNIHDTKYEYMYTYKYPSEEPPEGGEAAYLTTLKKEILGYNWDISVLGLQKDTDYFDVELPTGKNKAAVSTALAQKYGVGVGDELVLHDEEHGIDYAFQVESIATYAPAFYVFMDIDDARDLFGAADDAYNVVFADHDLHVDASRLYAAVTKDDIVSAAGIFSDLMRSMVIVVVVISTLIFVVVMYLMMKVMIDRSAFSISLIKVFGFRKREIRKLYLDGNFYIIAGGAAVCLPLSKFIMDQVYPFMVSNVNCGIDISFAPWLWIVLYIAILLLYFVINRVLVGRLDQILPAEVLKNRE